jgi:hypothetical protein
MVPLTREILDKIKNSTSDTSADTAAHNVHTNALKKFLNDNNVPPGSGKKNIVANVKVLLNTPDVDR